MGHMHNNARFNLNLILPFICITKCRQTLFYDDVSDVDIQFCV